MFPTIGKNIFNKLFIDRELKAAIKQKKHGTRRRYHTSLNDKMAANSNNEVPINLRSGKKYYQKIEICYKTQKMLGAADQ